VIGGRPWVSMGGVSGRATDDDAAARDAGQTAPGQPAAVPHPDAGPAAAQSQPESAVSQPRPVRLLLVDADRRVRAGLASLLELSPAVEVVATAGDVRAALAACERAAPDVVVVDPRLPELQDGIAFVSALREGWPAVRIVALAWSAHLELTLGEDVGVTVLPKADGETDLGERVIALVAGAAPAAEDDASVAVPAPAAPPAAPDATAPQAAPGRGGARVSSGGGGRPGPAGRVMFSSAR
jgi:CheY-like chemotaxis protein